MNFTNFSNTRKKRSLRCLDLNECLAKTYSNSEQSNIAGRDVFSHCLIVGYVARLLLKNIPLWMEYPIHSELVAASHDVGKICPAFQEKIRRGRNNSAEYEHNSYPGLESADPELEKKWDYHAGLSQITLNYCKVGKYIPEIVGQHHGFSPTKDRVGTCSAVAELYGGKDWQKLRELFIDKLKSALAAQWPVIADEKQARLLAGLTTVSDWLGSASLFDDPNNEKWKDDIEKVVKNAGFSPLSINKRLSFEEIFQCNPRPIQKSLINACKGPGIYILEAPMGIGKTEAALYAAYKMLESDQASGVYFALPTQLTSDKIFERTNLFLDKIVSVDYPNRTAILAHANARLKMIEFGEEGAPGGSWFSSHKRELLAPFGVGTIDQALMSVLNVKHGFVRAFGLSGKVVILDEIHSYDAYTGTIIDELIKNLIAWKCTVIVLSATLTKSRREKILGLASQPLENHYPLISVKTKTQFDEIKVVPDNNTAVTIHLCHNRRLAIEEVIKRAEEGQQVLWIENTVHEAQEIYKEIAAIGHECDVVTGLLHSRFIRTHRDQIESDWINQFGKDRSKRLEQGRILVGTQILEQSLDIDADFLVSRLCPTDMLLQRLGRLWRHKTLIRSSKAKQEAWILSPELTTAYNNPEKSFGKSYNVYSPYYLLRTLGLLTPLSGTDLFLPKDIRELIEATYQEREENSIMKSLKQSLEKEKADLQRRANVGLSTGCKTQSDDWAPTRYSELETCEVLIVKGFYYEPTGVSITLIDDKTLFLPSSKTTMAQRMEISLILHQNIVKVSENKAPPLPPAHFLKPFERFLFISQEKSTLRIVKLSPSDELISLDTITFPRKIQYNHILGYQIEE